MILQWLLVALGVAMIAQTFRHGGGVFDVGVVLGVLFCAAGAARIWAARRAP